MSPKPRLTAIATACGGLVLTNCAHTHPAAENDTQFPRRIVTPTCAHAQPPITLELLRVVRDSQPRKPSASVRNYLVDLRIRRKDREDLWLLVNEETFPSALDAVAANVAVATIRRAPQRPRQAWWFTGNDIACAYPLGSASESWFQNLEIGTSTAQIPVTLGTIEVDGLSPEEWVRQTGGRKRDDEPRAVVDFAAYCTTWIDIAGAAAAGAK